MATLVDEPRLGQRRAWYFVVSRDREVDVERRSRLSRIELHRDSTDYGVARSGGVEYGDHRPKRLLLRIALGQAHGFPPQSVEREALAQTLPDLDRGSARHINIIRWRESGFRQTQVGVPIRLSWPA
jgi:hypothetical protein